VLVGGDLDRRLDGSGCVIVNSLRFLGGGDIDHLVIGPGGITVIDAKNWSGTVTVSELVPRVAGWTKLKEVHKLGRQVAGVRVALLHARPELRNTGVRGVMCLATEPDRRAIELKDRLVLSGSCAAAEIAARPGALTAESIAHLRDVLARRIPRVTRDAIDDLQPPPRTVARRPRTTQAGNTRRGNGRSHQLRRMARSRRAHRARAAWAAALFALMSAAIGWWGVAHLRLAVPAKPGSVSQLSLARHHHHLSARYTAASGATVRLRIRTADRTRSVDLPADGRQQTWIGPRIAPRGSPVRVKACVVQSNDRCGASRTKVLSGHH
jgi:hypothetical protein